LGKIKRLSIKAFLFLPLLLLVAIVAMLTVPLMNKDNLPFIDIKRRYSDDGFLPDWKFMENYIKSLPYGDRL